MPENMKNIEHGPTTHNTPPRAYSLQASAKRLAQNKRPQAGRGKNTNGGEWQADAWDMYDLVGELRFLVNTLAAQISRARMYVGQRGEGISTPEPLENEDPITELLQAVGDSQSGMAQVIRRLALNLLVTGEGWLAGIPPRDPETGERASSENLAPEQLEWEMLSVSEVEASRNGDEVKLILDEGEEEEFDPTEIYLIRVWQSHPRQWWEADSATRASLPVLKELVGLTMHVSAQIESRLAGAGLLVVPQSANVSSNGKSPVPVNEFTAPPSVADEFTDALIESMITPINDRASASAVVPVVVTVPDEAASSFNYLTFDKPLDAQSQQLREEAIRRLALAQDAPPELLLGTGDMNHWGGWLVQEQTVSNHIEPILSLICDALTSQYLWPALMEQGMSAEEAENYVIWFDVSDLVTRPNLGQDARDLHAAGVLSDEALRRSTGFDETDAPEVDLRQKARDTVLSMIEEHPELVTAPGIDVLVEQVTALLEGREAGSAPVIPDSTTDQDTESTIDPLEESEEDSTAGPLPQPHPADLGDPGLQASAGRPWTLNATPAPKRRSSNIAVKSLLRRAEGEAENAGEGNGDHED